MGQRSNVGTMYESIVGGYGLVMKYEDKKANVVKPFTFCM
jgi:hypothetical protein